MIQLEPTCGKGGTRVDESQLDEAYRRWVGQETRAFGDDLRTGLAGLSPREAARWTLALAWSRLPVAETLTEWLRPPASPPWRVAGGLEWDAVSTPRQALVMVPLPLADDPLAMAAMCPVWAIGGPADRLGWMVARMGPAIGPSLYASGFRDPRLAPYLGGWRERYGRQAEALGLTGVAAWAEAEAASADTTVGGIWPPWPEEVERFRDHLAAGLVPHRARGQSPEDPAAVLLALAAVAPPEQQQASTELAIKAIQGALISARWQQAGEEAGRWS